MDNESFQAITNTSPFIAWIHNISLNQQKYIKSRLKDLNLGHDVRYVMFIYDNPNCYVAVYDVQDKDLSKGLQIALVMDNRASKWFNFSIENAWINGVEINPTWFEMVMAGESSHSKITWSGSNLKDNGIEKIDEIRLLFSITDANNAAIHKDMLYIVP